MLTNMMRCKDAEAFQQACTSAGFTQNGLADFVEYSRSYVSLVARGLKSVRDESAALLAEVLSCDVALLFEPVEREMPRRLAINERVRGELHERKQATATGNRETRTATG